MDHDRDFGHLKYGITAFASLDVSTVGRDKLFCESGYVVVWAIHVSLFGTSQMLLDIVGKNFSYCTGKFFMIDRTEEMITDYFLQNVTLPI